jgi:hypothetical protein
VQRLAAERRQAPVKKTTWARERRRPRGSGDTQPVRSAARGTRKRVPGQGAPLSAAGKPTARRAQLPGRIE